MKLVIEDEAGTRSVVPLGGEAVVVGRGTDGVSFRLGERNVSRRHARFLLQTGAVFVEDLGSLNGTRVNGERITGRRRLREGDLVQIGDYDLAILAEAEALAPGAPPPLPPGPRAGPDMVTQSYRLGAPAPAAAPPLPAPAPAAVAAAARSGRGLRVAVAVAVALLAAGALALLTRP